MRRTRICRITLHALEALSGIMMTVKNLVSALVFLVWSQVLVAQTIVNTETLILPGDSGIVWTAGVSGDVSAGNSDVVNLKADAGLTKGWGHTSMKVIGSWNRLARNNVSIQSGSFAHMRLVVGQVDRLQGFGFVQTSANDVLLMTSRNLFGAGIKRRIWNGEHGWGAVSWGAFWEAERYTVELEIPSTDLLRNSFVFSGGWRLNEHVNMRYTAYVQSDIAKWSDSRAFFEWSWAVSLADQIKLEWNLGIRWDGEPHANLAALDLGSRVGLRFGFGGS